jgi:Exoribonuclease R
MPYEFPPEVLEEARERTTDVEAEIQAELDDRRDLRDMTTWTTDPVDAQDFDDALSVEEREDSYVLWVHIADVSHYVHPDTEMWSEARDRGNTVYLPGHTVHMLPPTLAETVCSLVPHEDRLAHTVEMHLDKEDLGYDEIDIYKSVIRSDARLTYTQCEEILDDPAAAAEFLEDPELLEEVGLGGKNRLIWELAEEMHEQRKADGSLVLNPRRDRAHTIIEECMLKANKAVTHELMWTAASRRCTGSTPSPRPTSGARRCARFRTSTASRCRARSGASPERRSTPPWRRHPSGNSTRFSGPS